MKYQISFTRKGPYVLVEVFEPMTVKLAAEIAMKATETASEHNSNLFLYDVRKAPNVDPCAENYFFAHTDMPAMQLDRSARVALLASPDDESHKFIATAIRNAGYNVRLFFEEEQATEWLTRLVSR